MNSKQNIHLMQAIGHEWKNNETGMFPYESEHYSITSSIVYYSDDYKELIRQFGFFGTFLFLFNIFYNGWQPKFLQKYVANYALKQIPSNIDVLIIGVHALHPFRLMKNKYFFSRINKLRKKGVKTVFYQNDYLEVYSKILAGKPIKFIKKILIKQKGFDSFDLIMTYSKKIADDFNVRYCSVLQQLLSESEIEDLKKTEFYRPSQFELTYFGFLATLEKFESVFKAFQMFEGKINYGLKTIWTNEMNEVFGETKTNWLKSLVNLTTPNLKSGDYINRVLNTNCIMHTGGVNNYLSPAHFEAVQNDIKIITDSDAICLEPFYDENFVRVVDFCNITEDDIKWIKAPINVKYSNKECLTIEYWVSKVINLINDENAEKTS